MKNVITIALLAISGLSTVSAMILLYSSVLIRIPNKDWEGSNRDFKIIALLMSVAVACMIALKMLS